MEKYHRQHKMNNVPQAERPIRIALQRRPDTRSEGEPTSASPVLVSLVAPSVPAAEAAASQSTSNGSDAAASPVTPKAQAPAVDLTARIAAISDRANDAALLDLIRIALASTRLDRSAAVVATELARIFGCERAFVGTVANRFVRVRGISHGTALGTQHALAKRAGAAMDEAVDQGASVLHPQHPDDQPRITLAHAELARGSCIVLTVPVFRGSRAVGALTLERALTARFEPDEVRRLEAMAGALAPVLLLQAAREVSFWQRQRSRLARGWRGFGAQQRAAFALVTFAVSSLVIAALVWPVPYRITAPTRLEGQIQRAIAAPLDGYLKSANARAGDMVKAGQLLAELVDDDLRLDRRRWESEVARYENAFAEAQAKGERAQLVIADARVSEARAQLAQVDQQITRTRLVAPFDALVIKGDLTQQLGAPIKRGDMLLTLTPSREIRVILEVDERDVGQISAGGTGAVTLSALPDRSFQLVIERVMPVARADAGRNLFEAEARLQGVQAADASALRPGLQGTAKLNAGERPIAWQVSHRFLDWLRLQWWSWMGST